MRLPLIWDTTDRFGRRAKLTQEEWTHIVADHTGWTPTAEEVRQAVEKPTCVTFDADIPNRECFYRDIGRERLQLKVVVHYRPVPPQGTWDGTVVTAYFTRKVKPKEVSRWP